MLRRLFLCLGISLLSFADQVTFVAAQDATAPVADEAQGAEQQQPRRGFRGQRQGGMRGGRRFGGRFMGMVPLLQIDSVKQELKLEGDQATQVESLTVQIREDFADQLRELMQALREAGPEDRQQLREKMAGVTGQINDRLTSVLKPEQMGRLKQINLQLGLRRGDGAEALTSGDIATALDLTAEQQEQLREQATEVRSQPDRQTPTLAEAREEVNKVLTPEQQDKLDNLLGTEFDLPAAMLEGGRQRGFRRGPQAEGEQAEAPANPVDEQSTAEAPAE